MTIHINLLYIEYKNNLLQIKKDKILYIYIFFNNFLKHFNILKKNTNKLNKKHQIFTRYFVHIGHKNVPN